MAVKHKTRLNPKQEKFCQLYASDKEFFGNGVESYLEAYSLPPNRYNTALANASRLLTNASVLARINELLDIILSDEVVDKELAFVVLQKKDLSSKVQAIREYNRVRKRVEDTPQINLNLGILLTKIEQANDTRTKTIEQGLSSPDLLLDKGQAREESVIPTKQSTTRLPAKKA